MGGRQQIAHNQFWGRQFGAHHFHHGHGFFWAGPVFWPFAFGDIFSFAPSTNSLTDEQHQRLQGLAEDHGGNRTGASLAEMCSQSARHFTELPSEQIQETIQPNDKQRSELDALKTASSKAADILNGTCPSQTPSTPTARLDAMAKRLDAMSTAVKTMRPSLQGFYASLDDEQKARFNTMNEQAQRQG